MLERFQKSLDSVVIAGGNERERPAFRSEDQPGSQPSATFEDMMAKTSNANTRMKMRFAESFTYGIESAPNFCAPLLREPANRPPKAR